MTYALFEKFLIGLKNTLWVHLEAMAFIEADNTFGRLFINFNSLELRPEMVKKVNIFCNLHFVQISTKWHEIA